MVSWRRLYAQQLSKSFRGPGDGSRTLVGWGVTEEEHDDGNVRRYIMTDGAWYDCPDDLWGVIVAGLEARDEKLGGD